MALVEIPNFCGPTAVGGSTDQNSEQTINCYIQSKSGRESPKRDVTLIGTPGLLRYLENPSSVGLGAWTMITTNFTKFNIPATERTFYVTGQYPTSNGATGCYLIELLGSGGETLTLNLPATAGPTLSTWKLTAGTSQLLIIGNGLGYVMDIDTGTLTNLNGVGSNFPGAVDSTYQDGYFAVIPINSQRFYISAFQDGTQWDPLDFALENDLADRLIAIKSYHRELWVFGQIRTEIWSNTGNALFPFQRNQAANIRVGCLEPSTVREVGGRLIWVGHDVSGGASVYMATGYQAQRISTPAIDTLIQNDKVPTGMETCSACDFRWRGHDFYVLRLAGRLSVTLLYDVGENAWTTWSSNADPTTGSFPVHLATCSAGNRHINEVFVGSAFNNRIYVMRDIDTDDGAPIWRLRTAPHMGGNGRRQFFSKFLVDGKPSSAMSLQWQDTLSIAPLQPGQVGISPLPYEANPGYTLPGNRIMWTRLGSAYNDRVWQVTWTDGSGSPSVINAAFVDIT